MCYTNHSEGVHQFAIADVKAAQRLAVTFLVVDIAQRSNGQWIVIECNDGQESGYAGLSPFSLWKNILAVEQGISGSP